MKTLIIGAGTAGIFAARELQRLEGGQEVVILEARDRIGGRVHTVVLRGVDSSGADSVSVDSGATWLQQFAENNLVEIAREAALTLIPSDFDCPLRATSDSLPFITDEEADAMIDR